MKNIQIKQSITDRNDETLKLYLKDVSKESLITSEREQELSKKILEGDEEAYNELVKANLRFVISVAKQYQNQGLPLMDLINEGNIGLCKAARKYDADKGVKFISYAVWWIRQAIMFALSDASRTIRVPINQLGLLGRINKTIATFEQQYQRKPSYVEIEEITGIDADKIEDILNSVSTTVSVDTPFKTGEEGTLIDVIPNKNSPKTDSNIMKESVSIELDRILSKLTNRENDIIKLAFGIGVKEMPLEEIAKKFGLTSERIRQIKEGALSKLKTVYYDDVKLLND